MSEAEEFNIAVVDNSVEEGHIPPSMHDTGADVVHPKANIGVGGVVGNIKCSCDICAVGPFPFVFVRDDRYRSVRVCSSGA